MKSEKIHINSSKGPLDYTAEEYFKKAVVDGKLLEALLITENGKSDEKLLGIITPLDLMKVE
jgi:hypothetical protein